MIGRLIEDVEVGTENQRGAEFEEVNDFEMSTVSKRNKSCLRDKFAA